MNARRRARPRWRAPAVWMAALLAVFGLWLLAQWPGGHRNVVGDLFSFPFDLAAAGAAWAASRRCHSQPRLRAAWRLLTLALTVSFLGDLVWTAYEVAGASPYPSVADVLYLAVYPLVLLGVLRFPTDPLGSGERVRLGLDLTIVALGGIVVVVYVVLGPTIVQSSSDPLQTVFSIAYPVGDMIMLVAIASVLLRRTGSSSATALYFIVAGLLLWVLADVIYGYLTLHSGYASGGPLDMVWITATAMLATAGAAQAPPEIAGETFRAPIRQRASWAPLIAIAVAFGLLLLDLRGAPLIPDGTLIISAAILAMLVSIRQFLAQKDLVRTQQRLSYQSLHDALTGLPNRVLLIDRAEQMLARARRTLAPAAVLYVDIDGFKQVNDSFGHAAGDELLRVVSTRIQSVLRDADTVGRLGGDEFAVLLDGASTNARPELVAERICDVVGQPVELRELGGRALNVSASIGIALGLAASADELLREADCALYEAKAAGKNRWVMFESRMQAVARDRVELGMDLRHAVDRGEFFLVYQPTYDLRTEALHGLEALLRWRHPVRGLLMPAAFIGLAEETGLIVPIGRWVLRSACEQTVTWHHGGHRLGISVNVSGRQLDEPGFVAEVAETLELTGLEPSTLTLEITETALMRDAAAAAGRLRELKELGVRIAIDDFGTGYSSMAYLRQFAVDSLKIDRSFIAGIASGAESEALIHTLVQLGKTLGLETLGEGIEEPAQLLQLQHEQCDLGQGFLLALPLDPNAVDELLDGSGAAVGEPRVLSSDAV